MKPLILLLALVAILASCATAPTQPKNVLIIEGPGVDSVKVFFEAYVAGDWEKLRSLYQDTASSFLNASERMSVDSLINFHKYRRSLFEKVEYKLIHAQVTKYEDGETWRAAWAELLPTVKGSGEVIRVPIHMAWQMAGSKVGMETGYYDRLPLFQAITKANEANAKK